QLESLEDPLEVGREAQIREAAPQLLCVRRIGKAMVLEGLGEMHLAGMYRTRRVAECDAVPLWHLGRGCPKCERGHGSGTGMPRFVSGRVGLRRPSLQDRDYACRRSSAHDRSEIPPASPAGPAGGGAPRRAR